MRTRLLAGLVLAALVAGCGPRPRAPALLQDEALYVNAQEGFRFVPPPNWPQHARAEWSKGPAEEEHLLVAYRRVAGKDVATFEVSMQDAPKDSELAEVVTAKSEGWKPVRRVEELEIDGRPAVRGSYRSRAETAPQVKEIVVLRNKDRIYFFIGIFTASDEKSREQVRKAIDTISW